MARERRKWTPEEDLLLKSAVAQGPSSEPINWHAVASQISGRTNKDCRKRWHYKVAASVDKGTWTAAEDERLQRAIKIHGTKWALVATEVGNRNGDQCSKRWNDAINPDIDHSPWKPEEDKLLLESVEQYGRNWKAIGSIYFKRRTSLGLKNRHSLLLRHIDSSRLGRGSKKSTIVASAATSRSASVARYPNDSDGDDNEADASDRESSVEEEREYICSGSKKRSSRQSASRPPTRPTSSAKRPSEFSDSGNREAPSSFGLSPRGQGAGFMTAAAAAVAATTAGADSLCQTSISVPSSSTSAVVGQHDGIADQVADYELSESPADGSGSSGPRFTDFNIDPTLAFDPMQQGFGPHPDLEMTTAATTASDVMTAATSSAAAMTAANAMAPMAADPTMADMPNLRELSSFAFPCGLESEDSFSLSESAQGGVYPTTQAGSMGLVSPISSSSPHDGSAFPLHSSMQGSAAYRDAIAMGLEGFCDSNARKQVTLTVNCASERLGELLQVTMEAVNSVTSSEENANVLLNVK